MAGLRPLLYNTNGFAFHRLEDAVRLLASLGYDGVALTPDVHHLDPSRSTPAEVAAFARLLRDLGLTCVIETGARFVLDPARKHRPTLLDDEPGRRAPARLPEALRRPRGRARRRRGLDLVGARPRTASTPRRPTTACRAGSRACARTPRRGGVRIGFEPEPGMLVETVEGWTRVRDAVGHATLGLTLDVGHCLATREGDPARILRRHAAEIVVLQVDDHRAGRHDHLLFGEGDVPWPEVAGPCGRLRYEGPIEVELSRHSSEAPEAARRSAAFLRPLLR